MTRDRCWILTIVAHRRGGRVQMLPAFEKFAKPCWLEPNYEPVLVSVSQTVREGGVTEDGFAKRRAQVQRRRRDSRVSVGLAAAL
jgi:hypothetical protein